MMRRTKGFSYDPKNDNDVIEHIKKQPNGSRYIWDLVRKDIKNNNIESIIKRHIEKYLKDIEHTRQDDAIKGKNILDI